MIRRSHFRNFVLSALALIPAATVASGQAQLGTPIVQAADQTKKPEPAAKDPKSASEDTPPASPVPNFGGPWDTRTKLAGDWMGFRTNLATHGITIDASLTQFSQGVTSGGRQQDWVYGGHGDYFLNVDGEKAGLWKGFYVTMHSETRYGSDVNNFSGALVPPNTTMLFPQSGTDITAITSLKFTQALSEKFLVFAGKINTIDEFQLGFVGPRNEAFMNAYIFQPVSFRTVPYSTYGAGFAVLKDLQPIFSFMAIDPEDRSTTGPTHLFERGVVLLGEARLPVKPFGLPGHQIVGGMWSSASYRATDRESFGLVPGQGIVANQKTGSWAISYAFDQYLWVDPCNPKRGWGIFGQAGLADGNPNPIRWSFSLGVGGSSPLRCRAKDTFGVGYYFVGLSDDFKNLLGGPILGRVLSQRNEQGVELFYNFALTPYCHLSPDLQVISPSTQRLNTAVIPGVRLKLDF